MKSRLVVNRCRLLFNLRNSRCLQVVKRTPNRQGFFIKKRAEALTIKIPLSYSFVFVNRHKSEPFANETLNPMKKALLITLFSALSFCSFAAGKLNVKQDQNNSKWDAGSTWNLNRAPVSGDTVIIPAGKTVIIDNMENLAHGNANNVYVQVYGTLLFQKNGKLVLNENSKITVYPGGVIRGTGSSSQSIRIGNKHKFFGNEIIYTYSSPRIADPSTDISPYGFTRSNDIVLPVKFVSFSASSKYKNVLIEWTAAEEGNAGLYELERSENAKTWTTVTVVSATGNGAANHYSYTDKSFTAEVVYYRVKQVDPKGNHTFSEVNSIKREGEMTAAPIKISAKNSQVVLQFDKQVKGAVEVNLISLSGQVLSRQTLQAPVGQYAVSSNLKGAYIVSVSNAKDLAIARQISL